MYLALKGLPAYEQKKKKKKAKPFCWQATTLCNLKCHFICLLHILKYINIISQTLKGAPFLSEACRNVAFDFLL